MPRITIKKSSVGNVVAGNSYGLGNFSVLVPGYSKILGVILLEAYGFSAHDVNASLIAIFRDTEYLVYSCHYTQSSGTVLYSIIWI